MQDRYVEVVAGDFKNRGLIHKISDLPKIVEGCLEDKLPVFRSYYCFDEEIVDYVAKTGSIKNFKGLYYLDRILFDVDKGELTDEGVLEKCRKFVQKLISEFKVPDSMIQTFYSGTGYHVVLPDVFGIEPSFKLPGILTKVMKQHFPEVDPITDRARIIRVEGSWNTKSERFKVHLSPAVFNSSTADQIIKISREGWTPYQMILDQGSPNHILSHLLLEPEYEPTATPLGYSRQIDPVSDLYLRGEQRGTRHQDVLRIAAALRRSGVTKSVALLTLKHWAASLVKENPGEIETMMNYVYKDGDILPQITPNINVEVADAVKMENDLRVLAKTDFSETCFDLGEIYPLENEYKFYPGEFVVVVGDTGRGKTAWVQNIVTHLSHHKVLYLSLEVSQNLVYRRFLQIKRGMTKDQVMEHLKYHDTSLSEGLQHIQVVSTSTNLVGIQSLINELQPTIMVVDVVDQILSPTSDSTARESQTVMGLKDLAQKYGTIIIGVHHISKAASLGPLGIHSGKGSSAFEQKADKLISIEGLPNDPIRVIKSQKARDETSFRLTLSMDTSTFRFSVAKNLSPVRLIISKGPYG